MKNLTIKHSLALLTLQHFQLRVDDGIMLYGIRNGLGINVIRVHHHPQVIHVELHVHKVIVYLHAEHTLPCGLVPLQTPGIPEVHAFLSPCIVLPARRKLLGRKSSVYVAHVFSFFSFMTKITINFNPANNLTNSFRKPFSPHYYSLPNIVSCLLPVSIPQNPQTVK